MFMYIYVQQFILHEIYITEIMYVCIHFYIYICVCVCTCIYIFVYVFVCIKGIYRYIFMYYPPKHVCISMYAILKRHVL